MNKTIEPTSYTNEFTEFVKQGIGNYFIGTGYPNSNILFIGKESAIPPTNEVGLKWYNENASTWMKHIKNNTCECLEYPVDEQNPLRKGWGRNTWSKYQKLIDYIFEKKSNSFEVNFLKYAFTTEINDSPSKKTSIADKSNLKNRKKLLKNSEFIQSFPVIILACSNYIINNDETREIDDIFDVTYDGDEEGKFFFSSGNWFFTHHNKKQSKLVIHTRQLSADVKDEMLQKMASIIRKHLIDNDLYEL
jgi:hypothetical protein